MYVIRVGQNHTFIGIYDVRTVFLAGMSPYIRSIRCRYTVLANPIIYIKYVHHIHQYGAICNIMHRTVFTQQQH